MTEENQSCDIKSKNNIILNLFLIVLNLNIPNYEEYITKNSNNNFK